MVYCPDEDASNQTDGVMLENSSSDKNVSICNEGICSVLSKEETTDDLKAIDSNTPNCDRLIADEGKEWNPLEEVDSALLTALCDVRERKALLRLEQVVLDFMKEETTGYIEVGGAYNTIINGGQGVYGGGDVDRATGLPQQVLQDLQQQQQRGIRQTSFQRLILHRLADRFNIVRENPSSIPPNENNNNPSNVEGGYDNASRGGSSGAGTSYPPGLIRLVKVKESCVPPHLLIDVDLSLLVNYKNPRARGGGGLHPSVTSQEGVNSIASSLAASGLQEAPSAASVSKQSTPHKKMVIMKRNSSGGGSSNNAGQANTKREGKSRGGLKGKKMIDREKAYEEARARIFGVSASSSDEDERKGIGKRGSLNANTGELTPQNATAITPSSSDNSESAICENANGPNEEGPALENGKEFSRQTSVALSASSITGTAASKAVYRNRQQEENDPDFRRRNDVRPSYVPMPPNSVPFVPNPYIRNGSHAGYLNMAMGHASLNAAVAMPAQPHHQPPYYQFTPQDTMHLPNHAASPQAPYFPQSQGVQHQSVPLRNPTNMRQIVQPNGTEVMAQCNDEQHKSGVEQNATNETLLGRASER